MNIEANLSNLRLSPRKVMVVAKMLQGLSVREASVQLERELRRAALPLGKLLASAIANAEHNFQSVPENLVVSRVIVGEGRKLKRWLPRAQGRATPLWKRMSHIRIVLREIDPTLRTKNSKRKAKSVKIAPSAKKHEQVASMKNLAEGSPKRVSGVRSSRSIFHRKSV